MHILIVGDAGEDYLMNMVKRLKEADKEFEFSVLHIQPDINSLNKAKNSGLFSGIFSYYSDPGFFSILPKIHGIKKRLIEKKTEAEVFSYKYNKVFLFGFWPSAVRFFIRNRNRIHYLSGYMMGSDFLRIKERTDIDEFVQTINSCKNIIAGTPVLLKKMQASGLVSQPELHLCYIGHAPLDEMEKIKDISTSEARKYFNIKEDRIVITIGYNASPNQQHSKIIEALSVTRLPEKTVLLVPMGYGGDKNYIKKISRQCEATGIEFRVLEKYYPENEIAIFRYVSDIFIHAQESDNLSGSVQEHLYAGNAVITGSWHPYSVLKERGIKFFEFGRFDELPELLEEIIENLDFYLKDFKAHNHPLKFEKSFWRNNISDWHTVIKSSF